MVEGHLVGHKSPGKVVVWAAGLWGNKSQGDELRARLSVYYATAE